MHASDRINGKTLNINKENANSLFNLHRGSSSLSRLELKEKNAEIDRLNHQLLELWAIVWQAEQSISELQVWVDKLVSNEDQYVRYNINRIIRQLQKLSNGNNQGSQVSVNQDFIKNLQISFPALSSNDLRILQFFNVVHFQTNLSFLCA